MADDTDPTTTFILGQIKHFGDESFRLKSKKPLEKLRLISDAFMLIRNTLGTSEHDTGLDALSTEFRYLRGDILNGVKSAWKNYWRYRRLAATQGEHEAIAEKEMLKVDQDLRQQLNELRSTNHPLSKDLEAALEQLIEMNKMKLEFASVWKMLSWTGLWIDLKVMGIYAAYVGHRVRVTFQFHLFILLVPILFLGVAYSAGTKSLVEFLLQLSGPTLGLTMAFTLIPYYLKKFVFDKQVKKLQKYVECKLFLPLSARLMIARTLSLQIRTLQEK